MVLTLICVREPTNTDLVSETLVRRNKMSSEFFPESTEGNHGLIQPLAEGSLIPRERKTCL